MKMIPEKTAPKTGTRFLREADLYFLKKSAALVSASAGQPWHFRFDPFGGGTSPETGLRRWGNRDRQCKMLKRRTTPIRDPIYHVFFGLGLMLITLLLPVADLADKLTLDFEYEFETAVLVDVETSSVRKLEAGEIVTLPEGNWAVYFGRLKQQRGDITCWTRIVYQAGLADSKQNEIRKHLDGCLSVTVIARPDYEYQNTWVYAVRTSHSGAKIEEWSPEPEFLAKGAEAAYRYAKSNSIGLVYEIEPRFLKSPQ